MPAGFLSYQHQGETLDAIASGASYIGYQGDPVLHANSSGASVIRRE